MNNAVAKPNQRVNPINPVARRRFVALLIMGFLKILLLRQLIDSNELSYFRLESCKFNAESTIFMLSSNAPLARRMSWSSKPILS